MEMHVFGNMRLHQISHCHTLILRASYRAVTEIRHDITESPRIRQIPCAAIISGNAKHL